MLARVLLDYRTALDEVEPIVAAAAELPATSRVKTFDTLMDKLRRGMRLGSVQDVAGVRVVVDGSRVDQDAVVERLTAEFTGRGSAVRRHDRREAPSHGYRAVHLVVTWDGCPVEVQVRTRYQHAWANGMERLADRVGRKVRYGDGPDDPADAAAVDAMLRLAEELDTAERAGADRAVLADIERRITDLVEGPAGTVGT
jgi:ppGpp synthetase/RelA/SpoT-type nucleotidyltranferase